MEGVAARTPASLSEPAADQSRTRRSLSLLSGPRLGHGDLVLFFAIHTEPGLRAVRAELHRTALVLAPVVDADLHVTVLIRVHSLAVLFVLLVLPNEARAVRRRVSSLAVLLAILVLPDEDTAVRIPVGPPHRASGHPGSTPRRRGR